MGGGGEAEDEEKEGVSGDVNTFNMAAEIDQRTEHEMSAVQWSRTCTPP